MYPLPGTLEEKPRELLKGVGGQVSSLSSPETVIAAVVV